jgi:hypothetical protein
MTGIDIAAPFPEQGGKVAFKVKSAGMSMSVTETVLDYQPTSCNFSRWRACCRGALAGSSPRKATERA